MDGVPRTGLWCRWCGKAARRSEGIGAFGHAVHVETGDEKCEDGEHLAAPSAVDPALKEEAKKITAEFGDRWVITADLAGLYARVNVEAGTRPGTYPAVTGRDGDELRARLRIREQIDGYAAADAERREARQRSHP